MIINEKYFKEYSPIPLNYNMAELKNYIEVAAEIWVRPLIGYDFYDEIQWQVERNEVTPEIATLLTEGKLWQYLCYATCLEGLPLIWSHFSEQGITLGKSDHSDSITLKDLTYIESHLRRQTEFLKDSVKRFICEHNGVYPIADFCACGCDCCGSQGKLNHPNPMNELFAPFRRNTTIR